MIRFGLWLDLRFLPVLSYQLAVPALPSLKCWSDQHRIGEDRLVNPSGAPPSQRAYAPSFLAVWLRLRPASVFCSLARVSILPPEIFCETLLNIY